MKKQILYAEANYQAIVRRNGYFVDKTAYIEKLEQINNPLLLRPSRFGKSLLKFPVRHPSLTRIERYPQQQKLAVQFSVAVSIASFMYLPQSGFSRLIALEFHDPDLVR